MVYEINKEKLKNLLKEANKVLSDKSLTADSVKRKLKIMHQFKKEVKSCVEFERTIGITIPIVNEMIEVYSKILNSLTDDMKKLGIL